MSQNNQREITIQARVMALVHDMSSHVLLYKCMKFHPNGFNSFQLSRHEITFSNVPREIIKKLNKHELLFFCMVRRLIMLYKCMTFRRNISNGFQVLERTHFCDGQSDG